MYKLGIVTPCHITQERYDISLAWITSMLNCRIPFKIKHVIINDCSTEKAALMLLEYSQVAKKIDVEIINHHKPWGKWALSKNFVEGIIQLAECDYVISIPDDVLLNPWLFETIAVTMDLIYIQHNIKAVTYFRDTRGAIWDVGSSGEFDEFFNYAPCCDGFMLLATWITYNEMIKEVDEAEAKEKHSTLVWRNANKYLADYDILEYKESLAQHIGNPFSSMTNSPRNKERYIYAKDVNLWRKPKILK